MKNKRLEEERMKKIHDNDIKKLEKIINNLMENNVNSSILFSNKRISENS